MDLQSSVQLSDGRWKLVKAAALFCFILAGALLIVSLLGHGRASAAGSMPIASTLDAARA